jgi:hypothetical protein
MTEKGIAMKTLFTFFLCLAAPVWALPSGDNAPDWCPQRKSGMK